MNENIILEKKELKKKILLANLRTVSLGLIIGFELVLFYNVSKSMGMFSMETSSKNKIAVINFNKEITVDYVAKTIKHIDKVSKDNDYKEILFIMNSPGGSPAASEELSEYLKETTKHKKVTMYVEDIAASGGYYIASSIKPVNANKNAIVGSIGVIMEHYSFEELAKKVGIEDDYFAKGEFKKPISMIKRIDDKSKNYLDNHLLSPMYSNFIASVAENRHLNFNVISNVAKGQVFLANDPRIKGILVDNVTSLYKIKQDILKRNKNAEFEEITEPKEGLLSGVTGHLSLNLDTSSLTTQSTNITLK